MGSSSGFPIDLVLFGMIAAFLVLRLRSILGRRTRLRAAARGPAGRGCAAGGRCARAGRTRR